MSNMLGFITGFFDGFTAFLKTQGLFLVTLGIIIYLSYLAFKNTQDDYNQGGEK